MDQNPAPEIDSSEGVPGASLSSGTLPSSPINKFLPLIVGIIVLLIILLGVTVFLGGRSTTKTVIPTPTLRPTATPFPPPTLPLVTAAPTTVSATTVPVRIGRLAFIKDGDIYHSDLTTISLLVKNTTAAADKLSWSPFGSFLAWRPKSATATPSALAVFDKERNSSFTLHPAKSDSGELIDYTWSPDQKWIAILYHDTAYSISLYSVSSLSAQPTTTLTTRASPIKQLLWPDAERLLFSTDEGINSANVASFSSFLVIPQQKVMKMKLAPNRKKLLYSVGTNSKSDLYIADIDGANNKMIPSLPVKTDMGVTGLTDTILKNGFIPYAVWFPKGDKLLVGYHYLPQLPLVGIYDLGENSFSAIAPFVLYDSDVMIDQMRLLGARVKSGTSGVFWQLSLFTLEDNAKLGAIRVIPDASSPAFFDGYASSE